MSAQAEPLPQDEVSGTVVALASERAHNAQRAWREAQQRRLRAAQRAEQLALELKATEEQAEARVAAALAVAAARRAAQQRRLEAAARAERLELELQRKAQEAARSFTPLPFGPEARRRAHNSAVVAFLAAGAIGIALGAAAAAYSPDIIALLNTPAPAFPGASTDSLQLRLSYRISAQ